MSSEIRQPKHWMKLLMMHNDNPEDKMSETAEDINIEISAQTRDYNLVSLLKPSIKIDGDMWCILYGENIQDGVVGFGDGPIKAVYDFNKNWDKVLTTKHATKPKGVFEAMGLPALPEFPTP